MLILSVGLLMAVVSESARASGVEDTWFVRSRTQGYSFQTVDPGETTKTEDHFEFYQHFDGAWNGMGNGKWDIRFTTRFANDLAVGYEAIQPDRLHSFYVQYRFARGTRARLGRMFVQDGPASYTMDGLHLAWKPTHRLEFRGWGGSRSPYGLAYEIGKVEDQGTIGARAIASVTRWMKLSLGWAYLDRNSYVQWQKIGGEAQLQPTRSLRMILRAHYEMESESWDKVEIVGRYQPTPQWPTFGFQFLDRRQSVDVNTYWARFLPYLERVQLGRISARYVNERNWGAELEYFGSFSKELGQNRIGLLAHFPYGQLGYSARLGDAGEESRWIGDLRYVLGGWWDLRAGAMLSTYALFKDAPANEERDLVTLYLRSIMHLRRGFNLHLEVQSLENPQYQEDVRFLIGIDLALSGGSSRLGLGKGAWLQ